MATRRQAKAGAEGDQHERHRAAATAPAMMEGQDTPVTGEPADPPGATTTVSIISFAPKMKAPRTFRRNNEHLDGLFLTHGTFGGSSGLLPVEQGRRS